VLSRSEQHDPVTYGRIQADDAMNTQPILHVLCGSLAVMLAGWLVQRRTHDATLADLLWAACIGVSALYYGSVAGGSMLAQMLVSVMGGVWAIRLIMHLLERMLGGPEDARYRELRQGFNGGQGVFFVMFLRRAVSATLYSLPLYVAAGNTATATNAWSIAACIVYVVGLVGESYADLQLSAFRKRPRHLGHTCRTGLWRYSRHPNYFFGCIQWCSYALLAVGVPWTLWPLSLLGPLLTIAGWWVAIPAAEAQSIRTRGDDYRDYRAVTSMLLPWFPRGWPNDGPDTSTWYTPLVPSRTPPPYSQERAT
jgi:steroid 5-alpha reductase family enzyme